MNTIIVLLALDLAWAIWRDLDNRRHRLDVVKLRDNYDGDREVLHGNFRSAQREADYWKTRCAEIEAAVDRQRQKSDAE